LSTRNGLFLQFSQRFAGLLLVRIELFPLHQSPGLPESPDTSAAATGKITARMEKAPTGKNAERKLLSLPAGCMKEYDTRWTIFHPVADTV